MRSTGASDASGAHGAFLDHQDRELLDVYKREAPLLFKELAAFLEQHKGEFPRGIVNILDCSWEDLTAGALVRRRAAQPFKAAEGRAAPRAVTAAPVRRTPLHPDIPRKNVFIQGSWMAAFYFKIIQMFFKRKEPFHLFSFQNHPNVQPSPCCRAAECTQVHGAEVWG